MRTGLFVSFEGIDGAGKSSHIAGLATSFERAGRVVVCTREPGGTPLAEALRTMVLNQTMDALTESLLVFAARRDHLVQVIEPALARGEVVLCDRFTDATFAYQGAGRGFSESVLQALEAMVQATSIDGVASSGAHAHIRQPHLTLLFDVEPSIAAQRLAGARSPDRFEAMPLAFFERVRHGYAQRVAKDPSRFVVIDAQREPSAVAQQVLNSVRDKGFLP